MKINGSDNGRGLERERVKERLRRTGTAMVAYAKQALPESTDSFVILSEQEVCIFAYGDYSTLRAALEALVSDVAEVCANNGFELTVREKS